MARNIEISNCYLNLLFNITRLIFLPIITVNLLINPTLVVAATTSKSIYSPIPLPIDQQITDTLSNQDIPTGQGGFERDYIINFQAGEQVVIDLRSESFDTIVTLLYSDGTTVGENDDGPDGSTNSLLFARILKSGNYIVRVQAFGGQAAKGSFTLKVTRLRPE